VCTTLLCPTHSVLLSTLSSRTHGNILELVDTYSLKDNEFYFDRDPVNFNTILNYYRTEKLHYLDEICALNYADDLKFWMVHEINMHICCVDKFHARRDTILTNIEKDNAVMGGGDEEIEEDFGDGYFAPYQKAMWDLFEKPQSSFSAKVLSLISISLVLASLVGMCLNTFTWLQSVDAAGKPVDNQKLAMVEAICISYFTVEFLLRWAGSPQKWEFLKGKANIVDIAAIAPYYLTLFFAPKPDLVLRDLDPISLTTIDPLSTTLQPEEEEEGGFGNVGRVMQVFRIARIMRIFKLAKRSVGLQSIAHTVKTSWKDLGLLFMLVGMGQLVFGSLLYYIEGNEEDTGFTSIPQGMWWAVQTLTSLGYGDFPVQTVLGKLVGSMTAVCGVLVMALHIPIVVDNFADYYSEQKKLEAKELREEEVAKEAVVILAAAQLAEDSLVQTICRPETFGANPPRSPAGSLQAH
jgi:potassium voltage-gated channel Shab-related subfamily B protein 2